MEPSTVLLVALLALVALLVGVAIPTLVQIRRTARSAEVFFDRTGKSLDPVLHEVRETTGRLNRISAGLEEGTRGLQDAFRSIQDITRSLTKLRDTMRTAATVGSALGPALAAGAKALFDREAREGGGTNHDPAEGGGTAAAPPAEAVPDAGKSDAGEPQAGPPKGATDE